MSLPLAEDNNGFALALHGALARAGGNLFHSPLSVRTALAMTMAGARGETLKELQAALRARKADESFHAELAGIVHYLARAGGTAPEIAIANSLWGQSGAAVLPAFVEFLARHYGASFAEVDFSRDFAGACRTINQWASAATNGRIVNLLDPTLPRADIRLMLANAVYFKGAWLHPFDPRDTREEAFHLENGGTVGVRMMSQVTAVGYRVGPGYRAVTLPYVGDDLCMLVLLPDPGEPLEFLERSLTAPMLGQLMRLSSGTEVELFLPRFTLGWGGELAQALMTLGIRRAFIPGEADFSGISGDRPRAAGALYVSRVLHKAFAQVSEEGVEASAAAVVETAFGIHSPRSPPVFRVNRPFLFAIGDMASGAILFLGRVVDPTQSSEPGTQSSRL